MRENGIKLQRTTPLWPQANSEAENFMKPMTKAIRSAHTENKKWTKHLYQFLLNYRTTPHSTMGFTPAELLFNCKVHNKLPQVTPKHGEKHSQLKENDQKEKLKVKQKADKHRKTEPSHIEGGEVVLARQKKQNKLTRRFDPAPFQVVRKKGTMITAQRNGKYITRNASHFKRVDPSFFQNQEDKVDSNDDDDLNSPADQVTLPPVPPVAQLVPPATPRRSGRTRRPPKRIEPS